jgi:hypothetical protein
MRKRLLIAILIVAAFIPAIVVASDRGGEPSAPPWIDATGQLNTANVAANPDLTVGVAGPNGKPIVCANGKELRVKAMLLLAPPPAPSGAVPPTPAAGGYVYRCGRGPQAHVQPQLVPSTSVGLEGPVGND